MANNSYKVNNYSNCRKLFEHIAQNTDQSLKPNFEENKDVLIMKLSFQKDENKLAYYYSFGHNQVYLIFNDELKLITANPQALESMIAMDIEDFARDKFQNFN